MKRIITSFWDGSRLRQIALFALLLIFVFQLLAPSTTAAASLIGSDAHHQAIPGATSDCPMHLAQMNPAAETASDQADMPEKCPHCVLSTCCFHATFLSPELIAVSVLLPGVKALDRGMRIGSRADPTQERPPRHV